MPVASLAHGCLPQIACIRFLVALLLPPSHPIPLARALHSVLLLVIELQEFPTTTAGMKLEAVAAAASKSGSRSRSRSSSTVAFSWEQEPGVSKQSHAEANKPATGGGAPRAGAVFSRRTPAAMSANKKQAPAPAPATAAAATTAHQHRLRVPPPPGGPGAPSASPPRRRKPRRSRGVRPAEDPFLAAYLACTEDGGASGGRGYTGAQKLLGWAGLGFGLGLGLRGLGLSCKSSCGAVEECVVRLAKIPGVDQD